MAFVSEDEGMHYEGYCIRPPNEADSILLQVTLGCSHNRCTFCGTYRDKRFRIKDDKIILSDILFAARHMQNEDRLFLMDGDALIIPQQRLMWILERIGEHLPRVKRVGAYANVKSIKMKSVEELKQLRRNNLGILYYGVETGDDEIRNAIHKGSTAATCIEMGRRVKEAGVVTGGLMNSLIASTPITPCRPLTSLHGSQFKTFIVYEILPQNTPSCGRG